MKRINESVAADQFIERVYDGFYKLDRSKNTEVNYKAEKEERDTVAVKEFVKTNMFLQIANME